MSHKIGYPAMYLIWAPGKHKAKNLSLDFTTLKTLFNPFVVRCVLKFPQATVFKVIAAI